MASAVPLFEIADVNGEKRILCDEDLMEYTEEWGIPNPITEPWDLIEFLLVTIKYLKEETEHYEKETVKKARNSSRTQRTSMDRGISPLGGRSQTVA